ncbi:regulatory protein RecX [Georgenia faecalis]|uniref:regulatory protein RecX n=1 Tax=Georgenia faecalis TaxID=2483799 RepID=UPI000FD93167|nr:regulatory protein RecX [Georgenia faecalis]
MGRPRRAPEPPAHGAAGLDAEPDATEVARTIALRLLAAAPRSRAQLATKLADRGVAEDVAAALLDRFEEVGLLDDAAYAEMLVRTRHAERGLARRALVAELRAKGITGEVAEVALEQVDDEDEEASARALVARRAPATRGLERDRRRRRLGGMLARKGYPPGLAMRVVDAELAAEDDAAQAEDDGGA